MKKKPRRIKLKPREMSNADRLIWNRIADRISCNLDYTSQIQDRRDWERMLVRTQRGLI